MTNKILIVEDDADFLQELSEALADAGFCVEAAPDGAEGKKRLERSSYDIVILDYKMPNSSGIEVIRFIKEKGLSPRVFLVSGRPFIEKTLKEEDLSSQVTAVINKPFCVQTLLDSIKRV